MSGQERKSWRGSGSGREYLGEVRFFLELILSVQLTESFESSQTEKVKGFVRFYLFLVKLLLDAVNNNDFDSVIMC